MLCSCRAGQDLSLQVSLQINALGKQLKIESDVLVDFLEQISELPHVTAMVDKVVARNGRSLSYMQVCKVCSMPVDVIRAQISLSRHMLQFPKPGVHAAEIDSMYDQAPQHVCCH